MKQKKNRKKRWRRAAALFLTALLVWQQKSASGFVLAAPVQNIWDGESRTIPKTNEQGIFQIGTGAELAWFADEVNRGNTAINAELTDDIFLNDFETNTANRWPMIGDSLDHGYRGNFNGAGHKVYLLYAEISEERPEVRYGGLFGVIDGGRVSNLRVAGQVKNGYDIYGMSGNGKYNETYIGTGAVAGYLKSGEISNCVNETKTTMAGEAMYRNAGGIAGICSGTITRCVNKGNIATAVRMAQNNVGGIAGLLQGSDAVIRYCENKASVQGYFTVGGIAGAVRFGGSVRNSSNWGKISGVSILGGIAGLMNEPGTYSDGTVKQCLLKDVYSLGDMTGLDLQPGSRMGGLVGQMGYEDNDGQAVPSEPRVENGYSTVSYQNEVFDSRGAVVGFFKSGVLGNVFGIKNPKLDIYGEKENKHTAYSGETAMLSEVTMKSQDMIRKLGAAFVKTSPFDYDTAGFPKLAFQEQTTDLAAKIDAAMAELDGWLSEENEQKYGTAYGKIETAVYKYLELLGTVVTEEDLNRIMEAAREELGAIRPGTEVDQELMEAVDEGIARIEEYRDQILEKHPEYTEEEKQLIKTAAAAAVEKIQHAPSVEEVTAQVRLGKEEMDRIVLDIAEQGQMEQLKAAAKEQLEAYREGETEDSEILEEIRAAKEIGYQEIDQAENRREVTEALQKAKKAVDDIFNQIPSEGTWDGQTLTEPTLENGIYQIGNGAELAWFADYVNRGGGDACAVLTDSISLGGHNWTPIGGKDTVFSGSFDGNGYSVTGLAIEEGEVYAGLFGRVYGDNKQVIKNVTVSGYINCPRGIEYAGGIVAYIYGKNYSQRNSVVNCHSQVDITVNKVKKSGTAAGGIAGYADNTWFRGCSNQGQVQIASEEKGGVKHYAGGLVGCVDSGVSVRQSFNSGYAGSSYCAGGIAALVKGGNCEFTSNYNSGEVSSKNYAGGLAGRIDDGAGGTLFSWGYTSGPVNLNQSGVYVGALFGYAAAGDYRRLYALEGTASSVVGRSPGGQAPGDFRAGSEMQGEDFLNEMNGGGNYFIRDYMGMQNGYPILQWQLTLEDFRSGAIGDLQTFVKEEDYTPENWQLVQERIAQGVAELRAATSMEEVSTILTAVKADIYEIDSIRDTQEKELEQAKAAALEELQKYKDFTSYRDSERYQLETYLANGQKAIRQALTVEEVQEQLAQAKWNMDQVPTKEQVEYEEDLVKAQRVTAYIDQIGEVTLTAECKALIDIARSAYDALTPRQQEMVENYQVLTEAELRYEELVQENEITPEDQEAAEMAEQLIASIGEVTLESGEQIARARYAYEALTEKQQKIVSNLAVLEEAERVFDDLRAREVSAAIASIGEVTLESLDTIRYAQELYDGLTEKQQVLVTNYDQLLQAAEQYQNLTAAAPVIELIGQIGEVTLESGGQITQAIEAYNALNGDQQELVTNINVLERAIARYQSLAAADQVERMIAQIGAVSTGSGPMLEQIRSAYEALTEEEKALVTNLQQLIHAEEAYAALLNGQTGGEQEPSVEENRPSGENHVLTPLNPDRVPEEGNPGGISQENANAPVPEEEVLPEQAGEEQISEEEQKAQAEEQRKQETARQEEEQKKARERLETVKSRKKTVAVLGGILAGAAALAAGFGVFLHTASKKRKKNKVNY